MSSRQLNEHTKAEHKNNELERFCSFLIMCQSTISGTERTIVTSNPILY